MSGDHGLLFGRSRELQEVGERWSGNRLTVLHGTAGVGKTTLLRAGVVPMLRDAGMNVLAVGHVAHRPPFPVAALPEHNPFNLALLSSWYDRESPVNISGLKVADFLRRHSRTDRFGDPVPTLACIDQAEWLLRESSGYEDRRLQLVDELATAMERLPGLRLLLAVREDELEGALALADKIGQGPPATCAIGPFNSVGALEAVVGLLRGHGHHDERLARMLTEELQTVPIPDRPSMRTIGPVEPALLRLVCDQLGPDLADDTDLSADRLHTEVDRLLEESCTRRLATIAADHSIPAKTVYAWFRHTFGGPRGRAGVAEGPGLIGNVSEAVVRAVQDYYLTRVRSRDGIRYHELHPRLLEPVDRLGDTAMPIQRPQPPERLRQAELAAFDGDFALARRHVLAAARACGEDDLRFRAGAASLLGNLAYELGETKAAIGHYREAAGIFEAVPDNAAVGWLLAGIGRLLLEADPGESARVLQVAAARLPHELSIQTAVGEALQLSGRTNAAHAVLNSSRP